MTLFWLSLLPFIVLFVLLIPLRRPAYEAAPVAYFVTLVLALGVWQVSGTVLAASLLDALMVFIEVLLIVAVALMVLNVMMETGALDTIKAFMAKVTADDRVLAMLLGWALVGFVEGIAGFGTPAVLAAPVLVHFGFSPIKAVAISLIGNSTAVPFGAAGTPVVIGFRGLGLPEEVMADVAFQAAAIHAGMAIFITCFIAYLVTLGTQKGRFKEFVPFAIFSALSFSIPYLAIAYFVGPELPAVIGGASAIFAISFAARRGLMLHPEGAAESSPAQQNVRAADIMRSFAPFAVMTLALIVSRTVPGLRETLQSVTFSLGQVRALELDQALSPLYTPYFYLGLALITALLVFKVTGETLRKAAAATCRRLRFASVVLIFIIALTQLLLWSGINRADLPSIPQVLGHGFADLLGGAFVVFSPFLGAIGAFMTGSATVANLLFAGLQVDSAEALGSPVATFLALQLVGAGVGNMISLSNIAMAAGAVGLEAREGKVMRWTIIPVLVVCLASGLLVLGW
ncbi:MAG: L-lactate permease [Phycisphaeraceae bacterium]